MKIDELWTFVALGAMLTLGCRAADAPRDSSGVTPVTAVAPEAKLDRTSLPIPESDPPVYTELDVRVSFAGGSGVFAFSSNSFRSTPFRIRAIRSSSTPAPAAN